MADVRFTATLPERQHDWLRQRAYTERRSMAEILRDIIDGAMGPEEGTSVRIIIAEAGTDYTERIGAFEAKLVGAEAEMVAQAAALVAERGYRVLTNAEGGCCEYMSADEGDYIAITVAPTPDPDADDMTRPIDLVGKTLRAALDLITETGPESALDAAELEQVGRDLDEIVDRVYLPRDKRERQRGSLMIHAGNTFYLDAPTQHVITNDDEERDVCFRAEWELITDDPTAAADEQAVGYFCALAARGHDVDFAGVAEQRYRIGDDLYRVHIDTHDWEMTVYRHSAGADGKPAEPGVAVETVNL